MVRVAPLCQRRMGLMYSSGIRVKLNVLVNHSRVVNIFQIEDIKKDAHRLLYLYELARLRMHRRIDMTLWSFDKGSHPAAAEREVVSDIQSRATYDSSE